MFLPTNTILNGEILLIIKPAELQVLPINPADLTSPLHGTTFPAGVVVQKNRQRNGGTTGETTDGKVSKINRKNKQDEKRKVI